jgi:hypothetical protein
MTVHDHGFSSIQVDVYDVLKAFDVTCPARQHAIKKLLCSGLRDKGSSLQDLKECKDAVTRAIQLEEVRVECLDEKLSR